ncbi:MAG TPA: arsenate reductase (glutaredoxin) [Rhodanobacteraceae bacterium]|nr:arsenate reductase (glutaredoxin) [Rhodanobacteraceae bacterium]
MATRPVIWHNPHCSKSRATLELLLERSPNPEVVDYQKNPPDMMEISRALDVLKLQPRELMRQDESDYARLRLDNPSLTREQLIAAIAAHPILIQRPIVFADGNAAIGRPPEAVLAIL